MRQHIKMSRGPTTPWQCLHLPNCPGEGRNVARTILEQCRKYHYSERDLFALKLSLEEAITNAIKHGNSLDPDKHVHIQYRVSPQRVDVTIEDEGPGFNPAEVPDPTHDENLEVNHGRGILLMRAFMSSVVFNPRGNKVTLTKFNDASSHMIDQNVAFG